MALEDLPTTLRETGQEFLRHLSPWLLIGLVGSCVVWRLSLGDFGAADAILALGLVLFWPVQEWLIHVFVLHYEPVTIGGRRLDFAVPRQHREHHRDPWRLDIVFVPLRVYLYVPFVLAGLLLLPTAVARPVLSLLAVYFCLSLHYEWVHFLVHTRYRPKGRLYGRLWRNHRLHHFKNEHYWFGVTMLAGDRLLRTAPARDAVSTSPTARNLGEAHAS